jgi:hypothetical protein
MITSIEEGYYNLSKAAFDETRKKRFGISGCCGDLDIQKAQAELDLAKWLEKECKEGVQEVQVRGVTTSPIFLGTPVGGSGTVVEGVYQYNSDGNETVIEVNANGSITRINLGPVETSGATSDQYTHHQATPSDVWVIQHNLGFVPGNEFIVNPDGDEIDGVTKLIDVNTIQIQFSEPVTGSAYLS